MNEVLTDHGEIDVSIVNDFEKICNVSFPVTYVDLISRHNGLQFKKNNFDYFDENKNLQQAGFGFCGYGDHVDCENITDFQDHDTYGYEWVIVFGLRGNGDYICFDYRVDINNPSIVLMYHDQYIKDENGQFKLEIVKVADNFEIFIKMLHE